MQNGADMRKRASTLVDMLAVMVVTALSLSVLMPSLQKAREQARNAACISNLHSWGASFSLYGNDWNQKVCPTLVYCYNNAGSLIAIVAWDEILRSYYVDDKIRLCASAQKLATTPAGAHQWGTKDSAWHLGSSHRDGSTYIVTGSYGMNCYACFPEANVWEQAGSPSLAWHWGRLTVKNAHEIPILGDSTWREAFPSRLQTTGSGSACNIRPTEFGTTQYGIDSMFNMRRHTRSVNLVFYDGSVRHLLLPDLWRVQWSRDFDTNPDPPRVFPTWMTK
jgi:prepilin-type processing-associated H-X9-DG protein